MLPAPMTQPRWIARRFMDFRILWVCFCSTMPIHLLHRKNEFGGTPLGACLWGFRHGWDTGFPQDHLKTLRLLLEAGARRAADAEPIGDAAIDALLAEYR